MLKALILTYSDFQDQEVVYPYYRLLGANFSVTLVSDQKDEKGRTRGILGVHMPCQLTYDQFKPNLGKYLDEFELLILPGGVKALEKLRQDNDVIKFIFDWNSRNKIIASTCHGAQLLISAKVTNGKKVGGYYSIKDDINNSGGTYSSDPVTIDSNLITSPHYDHMGPWMEAVLRAIEKKKSNK